MSGSIIDKEIRMVLVGKTGVGKSALGNSLLGCTEFESKSTGNSVTYKCNCGHGYLRDGTAICVVDTPGLFDTRKSNKETTLDIVTCFGMSSPGPHVFLFVLRIGRFTKEEFETMDHLLDVFGNKVINYVVIVFTGKDNLSHDGLTFDCFLEKVPPELDTLIQRCGSRCVTINNYSTISEEVQADVDNIMKMVRKTIRQNGGTHYTGEMYRVAEAALKDKMRLIDEEKHRKEIELTKRYEEVERREKELEKTATIQSPQLEFETHLLRSQIMELRNSNSLQLQFERNLLMSQIMELRNSDSRQQVREEMESSDDTVKTIFKGIGSLVGSAVSGFLGLFGFRPTMN